MRATVDGFDSLEAVPLGYWPVIVVADVKDAAGFHTDQNGQPFALVEAGSSWSLTASHETLEMLADPFGNRLMADPSPKPGQGRVEFLVEVCDPSEDDAFAYTVNDVLVSDFYTPRYFDPVRHDGVRYSFNGRLTEPRQVLPGGYLSWHDPVSDHWFQETFFGTEPKFPDLGVLARANRSLREMIDAARPETRRLSTLEPENSRLTRAITAAGSSEEASSARAQSLRAHIEGLREDRQS
ncbi:hypothetical protein [Amycolatopsis balhimycina]|uniref:hypothetical protein n=1 Tax=Amycolatopsis balhimycina TaxID=208443 RepID=UPI000F7B1524|nr:hypothetical protein [Amycolatopsis balhimycina]